MTGATLLVIGAGDGIGKPTALDLARLDFQMILHGRSAARLED